MPTVAVFQEVLEIIEEVFWEKSETWSFWQLKKQKMRRLPISILNP